MNKRNKIIYWIATIWLSLGMASTGIVQLMRLKDGQGAMGSMQHLGYPAYLLTILGVWKLLGVVVILAPGLRLLKEWAYAGFFFAMSGALLSHLAMGDPFSELLPSLLLIVLTATSWYFRPGERKILAAI